MTIVEPVGVSKNADAKIPNSEQTTETIAEQTTTLLKLLKTRIAQSAGKMTKAEIKSEPTRLMASTMITAITTAIATL